jgi:hypothetical protein
MVYCAVQIFLGSRCCALRGDFKLFAGAGGKKLVSGFISINKVCVLWYTTHESFRYESKNCISGDDVFLAL